MPTPTHPRNTNDSLVERDNAICEALRVRRTSPVIRFRVVVHPQARSRHVGGSYDGALHVHVRAKALDGAATEEVLRTLASVFHVPTNAVRCTNGLRSRRKMITIDGDDQVLSHRLEGLVREENAEK